MAASASGAGTVYSPSGAPGSFYSAISATDFINVYGATYESNSNGWGVANDSGLTSGAWERGNPSGTATRGEPDGAAEGSFCMVTENGNGNFDIDGGCTTLTSPIFDASSSGTTVSYIRWFDNTGDGTGNAPNEDVMTVQVTANNGATWVNAEVVGPATQNTGGWIEHSFLVSDFVANTTNCRVRFIACDTGEGSVVEAATSEVEPPEPRRVFGERTRERGRSPAVGDWLVLAPVGDVPRGDAGVGHVHAQPRVIHQAELLDRAPFVHEEVRQRVSAAGAHLRAGQVQRHGGRVEREDRVARRSHRRGPVQGPPLEAEPLRAVRRDARADSLHSLRGCEGIPALTPPRGLRRPSSRLHALAPPKLVLVILPIRSEFVDGARHSVMR